ncbi:MAG: class I SAM-dependent methyltransferase, partial [Verrucomicrobiales bacterium]|nr:class I SAM-dependent methyltransferase [Verrucomicrobiales bacterium]
MNLPLPDWLKRRPRILNVLHALKLIRPVSSTTKAELQCLERHARGKALAVEIGTAQGVSAVRIARALAPGGRLVCVDPYSEENPNAQICRRELARWGVLGRVTFLRGRSVEMAAQIPRGCDFMFVDGDHSYEGLQADWGIVLECLAVDGIACFHDTSVPVEEPHRQPGSVRFFNEVIRRHPGFEW